MRWFWMLQAAGWALWFSDQMVWLTFDLFLQRKMPSDVSGGRPAVPGGSSHDGGPAAPAASAAFRTQRAARGVGLCYCWLLWWLYLYVSFVVCWQYISPNEGAYNRNFDVLSGAETILIVGVLLAFLA